MKAITMPRSIYYGEGSINKLSLELERLGKKALIVSDHPMNELGYVKKLKNILEENHLKSTTYLGVSSETKDTHVEEALTIFQKEQCDFIIALGGGSCIDAAKACAVLVNNPNVELIKYVGAKEKIKHEPAPVVAIPTTAGTGSEVTDALVVTNTKLNVKMMIKQPILIPQVAIVDPELTLSAPKSLTVATGIDALSHGIEAFLSKRSHTFTNELALSAIEAIVTNIEKVYEDGSNLEARTKMSYASMQAGIAFSNSSVTLIHGMSRPIGALFNVPHGISNAMLLVPALEYTFEDCKANLTVIGRKINKTLTNESDEAVAKETLQTLKNLCKNLNIPSLQQWGIDEDEFQQSLDKMATDALASGSPANHPRLLSKEEIIELYKICFTYQYDQQ